jgi:hypothetical protein
VVRVSVHHAAPLPRRGFPATNLLPVSAVQAAVLSDQVTLPGAHQVSFAMHVRGPLPGDRPVRAVGRLLQLHPLLRSTFAPAPDGWVRRVHDALPIDVPTLDLSPEEAPAVLARRASAPIDVSAGPPIRVELARLSDEEHILAITMHHVAYDAASIGPLVEQLSCALADIPAPPPWADHLAFVEAERAWLASPAREVALAQARAELRGRLCLPLPVTGGATVQRAVGRRWSGASLAAAARASSPLAALLAGWWTVLGRWLGRDDLALGTTVALRPPALREVIGPAFQYVPLAPDIPLGADLTSATRAAHTHLRGAFRRAWLPLAELGATRVALGLNANLNFYDVDRLSGADVVARYRRGESIRYGALTLRELPLPEVPLVRPYDLNLAAFKVNDRVAVSLRYRPDLLDAPTATALLDELGGLLGMEAA